MILKKVEGINGSLCNADEKVIIWRRLGEFASVFHDVKRIDDLNVPSDEFHEGWEAKLEYNLEQLSESDSLLKREIFDLNEHRVVRQRISNLKLKSFEVGLVHGDLSPRNVIWNNTRVTLLDWGSAKIDIVPHAEIGVVQSHNELEGGFFEAFLQGLQISEAKFHEMREDILEINLLNKLDLYRWAEGSIFQEIDLYGEKLRQAFEKIKM